MPSIQFVPGSLQKLKLLPLLSSRGLVCLRSPAQFEVKDAILGEGFLGKVRPRPLNWRNDSKSYFLAANRLFLPKRSRGWTLRNRDLMNHTGEVGITHPARQNPGDARIHHSGVHHGLDQCDK